ncbi:ATP-binding protein [Flavobacterium sp.]|uniref:PAS domain-containing sensor histidine kinase n=1 Tax=Flavobacterium sp. TaxID=239 RepID=UPI0039E5FEA9
MPAHSPNDENQILIGSEAKLQAFVSATSDIIYEMSADWHQMNFIKGKDFLTTTVDPRTGWTGIYIPGEEKQRVWEHIQKAIETKGIFELEHRVIKLDGSIGWTFSRAIPILDEQGEIVKWFGAASDITERKLAQQEIQKSEQKFRTLFESMEEGYTICEAIRDANGKMIDYRFLQVNPALEKLTGLDRNQTPGKTAREVLKGLDEKWFEIYQKVIDTRQTIKAEDYIPPLNKWYSLTAFYYGPEQFAVLFDEITARKRVETNLAFLAEISQDLTNLKNIEDTMSIIGGKIVRFFNVTICAFGEIDEQLETATIFSEWKHANMTSWKGAHHMDDFHTEDYRNRSRAGETYVVRDVKTDSRTHAEQMATLSIGSLISVPLIRNGQWRYLLALGDSQAHDWREDEIKLVEEIAVRIWVRFEKARAEEALTLSEEKYRTLFNSIDEGFCTIEVLFENGKPVDYRFLEMNPAFALQTGLTNAAGKTIRALAPKHESFWFEIYGKIAQTGKPQRFEHKAEALNRWFDVFAFRIGDPKERKLAVLFNDIAVRKTAEKTLQDFADTLERQVSERTAKLQKSENELQDRNSQLQQTITQLESFNHIASHDLQEPLRKIQIFASRMNEANATIEKKEAYLAGINSGTAKMRELIDDLLVYSRLGSGKSNFRETNLNEVLDYVRAEYEILINERKAVIISADLPILKAIPFEMRQLFANLISNSIKFCERQPEIRITCKVVAGENLSGIFKAKKNADYVVISLTDNGIGFENENREKIFGLFQRLENSQKFPGTGIGLSIAEKVVKDHNGFIAATSDKGKGSVFTMYLPYRQ